MLCTRVAFTCSCERGEAWIFSALAAPETMRRAATIPMAFFIDDLLMLETVRATAARRKGSGSGRLDARVAASAPRRRTKAAGVRSRIRAELQVDSGRRR